MVPVSSSMCLSPICWAGKKKNAMEAAEATYEVCDNASPELKARIGYAMQPKCATLHRPAGCWIRWKSPSGLSCHTTLLLRRRLAGGRQSRSGMRITVGGRDRRHIAGARYGMSGNPGCAGLTQVKESALPEFQLRRPSASNSPQVFRLTSPRPSPTRRGETTNPKCSPLRFGEGKIFP